MICPCCERQCQSAAVLLHGRCSLCRYRIYLVITIDSLVSTGRDRVYLILAVSVSVAGHRRPGGGGPSWVGAVILVLIVVVLETGLPAL